MRKGKQFLIVAAAIPLFLSACSTTQDAAVQTFNADLKCVGEYEINIVGPYVVAQLPAVLANGTSGLVGGALGSAVLALQNLQPALAYCAAKGTPVTSPLILKAATQPIPPMPPPTTISK